MHKILYLVLSVQCFSMVISLLFRGGTVSWKIDGRNNIHISTRITREFGAPGCDINNTGRDVTAIYNESWQCEHGCSTGNLQVVRQEFRCGGGSKAENWMNIQGDIVFSWSTTAASTKQLTLGLSGSNRLPLGFGSNGAWNIGTLVDIRVRNDTGRPNRSPVTGSAPFFSLQLDCKSAITLQVFDEDVDEVYCRWAVVGECGEACNNHTSSLPAGILNKKPCTLTLDPSIVNGFTPGFDYLLAVAVEDFPKTPIELDGDLVYTSQSLSSVPLQFLIHISNSSSTCNDIPKFLSSSPDGSQFIVPNGTTWSQRVYVESNGGTKLTAISIVGPRDIKVTPLKPDETGRPNTEYFDLTWTPSPNMTGAHTMCFVATNSDGITSEQRCFILLAGYPDPCSTSPCQNKGQCQIEYTNFTCTCPPGIYGNLCLFDVDECLFSPCQHRGECFNTIGDYKCFCRPGYAGKNCSDREVCSSNPCRGQGDCVQNTHSYTCDCYHGFSGPVCQFDYDNCTSSPCENEGTCTDLVGGFHCDCPPQYTGQYCEQEIEFCNPSPCLNGGVCENSTYGYNCKCPPDFIGLNCELSITQVCNGDQSYCSCQLNGQPIRVPIPELVDDVAYERNLRAGVIGYPVGLIIGCGCCVLFHYFILPRCLQNKYRKTSRSKSSASLISLALSSRSTVYPSGPSPPPRYSSLALSRESHT